MFYVNVMNGVDDTQLRVRCIELKKIFIELDTIWKLDKVKLHGYNKKKAKKILKARLKYHLADVASNLIKEEEADNQDEVLFKETFVSLNDYVDCIKSKNESNSRVNDNQVEELTVNHKINEVEEFLRNIFPTCFEIADQQIKYFDSKDFGKAFDISGDKLKPLTDQIVGTELKEFKWKNLFSAFVVTSLVTLVSMDYKGSYIKLLRSYLRDHSDYEYQQLFSLSPGILEDKIRNRIRSGTLKDEKTIGQHYRSTSK